MKANVILFNRNLTSVCQPCRVQGSNRLLIGVSRFDGTRGFHTLELSLEDYEKHARALAEVSHLAMQRWEPHFVLDVPETVSKFWKDYAAADEKGVDLVWEEMVRDYPNPAPEPVFTTPTTEGVTGDMHRNGGEERFIADQHLGAVAVSGEFMSSPNYSALFGQEEKLLPELAPKDDGLNVPFFALKKIAKTEGVDITECEGMDAIRAAIRKHREKLVPA